MLIYIDKNYCCHTSPVSGSRSVDCDFFNGKSKTLVEGYRYIPIGETWVREDGTAFAGEMIAPAVPIEPLLIAQEEYERNAEEIADMRNALEIMGVTVDG